MSKFKIGKWYSWSQRGMQPQYGKVSELQECTVCMSPWIINQISYDDSGYFDPRNSTDIREISVDVVRNFLPAGHPDLEVAKLYPSGHTEVIEDCSTCKGTGEKVDETPDTPSFKFKVGDEVNCKNSKITAVSNGLEGGWLSDSVMRYRMIESCHYSKAVGNCYKIGELYVSETGLTLKPEKLAETPVQKIVDSPNPNTTEQWTPKVGEWVVIKDTGFNNSSHKWYKSENSINSKGGVYQVEDRDVNAKYGSAFTIKINDTAYGSAYVRKALPHEIPGNTPSPTNESLLDQAKRKYPVGIKVKCVTAGDHYIDVIKDQNHLRYRDRLDEYGNVWMMGERYGIKIYDKEFNIWAEIIEEPKTHPGYVECLRDYPNAFTVGKVYVFNYEDSTDFWCVTKDDKGVKNGMHKRYFKPSTREAYERQEGIGQAVNTQDTFSWKVQDRTRESVGLSEQVSGLGGSRDFLVGGKNGLLNMPDYPYPITSTSIMMTPKQIEQLYGIKFAEQVDLRFDDGKINFKKSSSTTQPSSTTDVKLPKALIMEAEDDNFNLITL